MFFKVLFVYALLCVVDSNNLKLGKATPLAKKIFEKVRRGTNGDWRSARLVCVEAPQDYLISAIYVTDLSNRNDGTAFIKRGGVGKRQIILGLQSSPVQNSSKFQLKIYAEKHDVRGLIPYSKDRVIAVELRSPGKMNNFVELD